MELLELERRLIGFDTVSAHSNLALIEFLEGRLKALGLRVELFPNADGNKANLLATLGAPDTPGLMLSGHTDVVPVEGQAWSSDPFTLTPGDGRFYGRGTADMKSFLAQVLLAVQAVRHRRLRLPLHVAATYDEEVGCLGAGDMLRQLAAAGRMLPRCAVIGEPTGFQVFSMHKGMCRVRVGIKGVEGHSSKPNMGANALYPAARIIQQLAELEAERRARRSYEDAFELPYTTVNAAVVHGGTAFNIIPNRCDLEFEFRTMPGEDPDYVLRQVQGFVDEVVLPDLRRQHGDTDIRVEKVMQGAPMLTPPGTEIEALALELTGRSRSGAAPYYTEGALYNAAGIPTVICGPGDIDQAHRANEFITAEQLQAGLPFLGRLIERVCL
ncbi:MAG: acetylornithine deacetylase [Candidatus Lambdaproteobacteria bacterium]|nr:acetylornithine deacetylase [Candidatus Lambdaproteobacteria bacterium]